MGVFDSTTTSTGEPWGPLQPGTMQGVDYLRSLLTRGPYAGPYISPINSMQTGGITAGAAGSADAEELAQLMRTSGSGLLPGLGQSFDFYGSALTPGGANPLLTNPDPYFELAGKFADNPYMDEAIAGALRDPYRMLTEQQLPGISTGSNLAGMAGGSQEAVERAIATRGFADRASDVGASMRMAGLDRGYGFATDAARADQLLAQNAANNLFSMGTAGLGMLSGGYDVRQKGATDLFNWGSQEQNLGNQQISADISKYYAPWELAKSYGSYINPLAGALKTQTTDKNLLGAYALQGLGPVLSGIGEDAWEWVKDWWETNL